MKQKRSCFSPCPFVAGLFLRADATSAVAEIRNHSFRLASCRPQIIRSAKADRNL